MQEKRPQVRPHSGSADFALFEVCGLSARFHGEAAEFLNAENFALRAGIGVPRAIATIAMLLLAIAFGASPIQAQDYARIAPREPSAAKSAASVSGPASPASPSLPLGAGSNRLVLAALKGVVFVPKLDASTKAGLPSNATSSIAAPGLPLLADPGFTRQVKPFLGQPLTLADLHEINQLAAKWYRAHGQPFVSVTVPPQNVSTGVVQVLVTEYKVDNVTVKGNRHFSSSLLRSESGIAPGETLTLPGVQRDLNWLNANPFRTVTTVFEPGGTPGETDVVLKTQDRLPVRVYSSFDNAGVRSLGLGEWSAGATWGNAFGLDQQLSYQFTRSTSGRYDAHALSWTIPLPWRDRLLIFGSYEGARPDVGANFGENGQSGQASLRYVHIFPGLSWLTQDVQIGYDFKATNNNLEFGGLRVFANQIDVDQFPVIYEAAATDPYGQTTFENQLVMSPGGMTGANNSSAFETALPGARADYTYDRIGVTRVTRLPKRFSLVSRVMGQVSTRNLMYSEQLGAGGPGSVRGYYTDTALGSEGALLSQEIRGPALSFSRLFRNNSWVKGEMQPGVFWDYAHVSQAQPVPNEVSEADLSSIGLDLHLVASRYFNFNFDMGWQLHRAPGAGNRVALGDFSTVAGL
ncbi:MAG: ShlB/FhaC/HecB family hemolysin secretion/activation protein [Terriglobia bacterium]